MILRKFLIKTPVASMRRFFSSHSPALSHDSHHDEHGHGEGHDHGHGHGHHSAPYDWRDDPNVNKELEDNYRDRGWNPKEYTFPSTAERKHLDVWPENYNCYDLRQNFFPERKKNDVIINAMPVIYN